MQKQIYVETDAERVARVRETNVVASTADIMALFRASRGLSTEEINMMLEDAKELSECN